MTARDFTNTHDSFQTDTLTPRRRRSHSTASSKSPPPAVGKRSPSPRIAFTATTIATDAKSVKNITRKVIRRLEELGHPADMLEVDGEYLEEKEDQVEVERALDGGNGGAPPYLNGRAQPHHTNGVANGHAKAALSKDSIPPMAESPQQKKVDWEIPRKLLHSSIGFLSLYLYLSEGDPKIVTLVLWTALAIIIPADILRLNYPPFARLYERMLGFLMRESEKNSTNGVIWYILGVNFVLTFYPRDLAMVSILILSWADTTASTVGRMFGSRTPRLPPRLPFLRLPLAPRKSLAGFLAASVTGACIAVGFWGWLAPLRPGLDSEDLSWTWDAGVRAVTGLEAVGLTGLGSALGHFSSGGWKGLAAIGAVAGIVSGVAEALDLGSLDDNLTLPIISGGCILGFMKFVGLFSS
ncbi:hypothetical protein BDN72DRAFT_832077 [Pluteus cervinus]|uniref:Uncharacterized protein n=1 Tax=Pluteus cervinus TaxID=181527 RepID=A0ACD3BFD6_9AGAR|nr:hypothetical protein BDN72DRAFT_832077 [Pluteus cervinus]